MFFELYELVADAKNTQVQIKMYLINEVDFSESTARRNIKGFVEEDVLMVTADMVGITIISLNRT